MTFLHTLKRYFGWCPRFDAPQAALFSSFAGLSIGNKVAATMMLLAWGATSLIWGVWYLLLNIPGRLDVLYSPPIARAFFREMMYFPTGAAILILITDYLITGKMQRRHKIELLAAVVFGSLLRMSNALWDFTAWLRGGISLNYLSAWASWPPSVADTLLQVSLIAILSALCVSLAYNIIKNRALVSTRILFTLSAFFLLSAIEMTYVRLSSQSNFFGYPPTTLLEIIMFTVVTAAVGVFLLSTALKTRCGGLLVLSTQTYLRLSLISFGLISIADSILNPGTSIATYWYIPWVTLTGYIERLALVAFAFFPMRFTVGEFWVGEPESKTRG